MAAGHPWSLTLGDFLAEARSRYGVIAHGLAAEPAAAPPQDRANPNLDIALPHLRSSEGRVVHLPGGLQLEDTLDPVITGSLCRRLGVPEEDFGLTAEEPGEADDFRLDN